MIFRPLLILAVAPLLAACDLNPLMGKPSDAQLAHERRVSAGLGAAPNPWHEPEADEAPQAPACEDGEFRVFNCIGGVKYNYWTGEKMA